MAKNQNKPTTVSTILNHEELEFMIRLADVFESLMILRYSEVDDVFYDDGEEFVYHVDFIWYPDRPFAQEIRSALAANEICF